MVKETYVKKLLELRKLLIANKTFLVQIKSAASPRKRKKLLKEADRNQLELLRDLIKNIEKENVEIKKSIFNELESRHKVKSLVKIISKFRKNPHIYSTIRHLRQFLLSIESVLPYIIQSVLKT